jgi:hypothetical protein
MQRHAFEGRLPPYRGYGWYWSSRSRRSPHPRKARRRCRPRTCTRFPTWFWAGGPHFVTAERSRKGRGLGGTRTWEWVQRDAFGRGLPPDMRDHTRCSNVTRPCIFRFLSARAWRRFSDTRAGLFSRALTPAAPPCRVASFRGRRSRATMLKSEVFRRIAAVISRATPARLAQVPLLSAARS